MLNVRSPGGVAGTSTALQGLIEQSPCQTPRAFLGRVERRRRCLIAPALGRPLNSSVAPDVRAPTVRGRWHFQGLFKRSIASELIRGGYRFASRQTRRDQSGGVLARFDAFRTAVLGLCLGSAGGCGYTLAA